MNAPRQRWDEMHYRLVSLWDIIMEKFDAAEFLNVWAPLFSMHVVDNNFRAYEVADYVANTQGIMRSGPGDQIYDKITVLAEFLDRHDIDLAAKRAHKILSDLEAGTTTQELNRNIGILHGRIAEQLESVALLVLPASKKKFYEQSSPLFGVEVYDKFPDARDEIEEAGKCLALDRNKAAVCHLMLAMEEALRALANKLGAAVQAQDGKWLPWLVITNNMESKIKALPEGEEKVAWWEVQSMLKSVGHAWRNPTMHPARSYDGEQAKKVFDAAKGFMSDLAQRL